MINLDLVSEILNDDDTLDAIVRILDGDMGCYMYTPTKYDRKWEELEAYLDEENQFELYYERLEADYSPIRYVGYYGHKPERVCRNHYSNRAFSKNYRGSTHDNTRTAKAKQIARKRKSARVVKHMIVAETGIAYVDRHGKKEV